MTQIVANRLKTPDGTILHSMHRHDYVTHIDANGEEYMLDGGMDYIRTNVNIVAGEYLTVYTNDNHSVIREVFTWGTRGPRGDQPIRRIYLKNMDIDHINAILETQIHIPDWVRTIFENELEYRT
jgi:hypothetical protein